MPEEIAAEAKNKAMRALGFSDHAPLYWETEWTSRVEDIPRYCSAIAALKEKYRGLVEIYLGLEIDYIPDLIGPKSKQFLDLNLDYSIGSVHYAGRLSSGGFWLVDSKDEVFEQGFGEIYDRDIRKLIGEYYQRIVDMTEKHNPDIVGHLDIVKLKGGKYFSGEEEWYRTIVRDALAVIAKSDSIIEINSGGLNKGKINEPYPSRWILGECRKLNIPVTISSDMHDIKHLTGNFDKAVELAKSVGYGEVYCLSDGSWIGLPLE